MEGDKGCIVKQTLYGREEFSNALCDEYKPERPDILAVAALLHDISTLIEWNVALCPKSRMGIM